DVLDVEGDVLLRLPRDDLGQLLFGGGRDGDFLDDDAVAGEGDGDVGTLHFAGAERFLNRLDDEAGVHDGAVHDRLRRERLDGHVLELVALAFSELLELHDLDGARTDVEPDERLRSREEHGLPSPLPDPSGPPHKGARFDESPIYSPTSVLQGSMKILKSRTR